MKEIATLAIVGAAGLAVYFLLKPRSPTIATTIPAQPGMSDEQAKWSGLASIFGSLATAGASVAGEYFDSQEAEASAKAWDSYYSATANGL